MPSATTKGVLVFPTLDGRITAGPTAHDQEDKRDWSVGPGAAAEIAGKVEARVPQLRGAKPVFSYAGLRPAADDPNLTGKIRYQARKRRGKMKFKFEVVKIQGIKADGSPGAAAADRCSAGWRSRWATPTPARTYLRHAIRVR